MNIPAKTLSILVIVALGMGALALLVAFTAASRRKPKPEPSTLPVHLDDVLRGILEAQARSLQRLEAAVRQLANEDVRLGERLSGAVQRVALIRYDAFEDVGGRLSFSCALLDERGDGVVMTSINGRQDTRVYAKPVHHGTSDYNLSEEEVEAIREALGAAPAPRQAVEAG